MAEISARQVKELRERTGLGMMECKKALAEAGGDLEKAEEVLRIRSGAKASKAASRVAAEGVIGSYTNGDATCGALVELNCETDFVAKNDDFQRFANALAGCVAEQAPANTAALGNLSVDGEQVETRRQALVQKLGENISIRRFHRIASDSRVVIYVHGTRIGVLVDVEGPENVGKDVAMHIAFAKPQFLSQEEVPQAVVAREREILAARAQESGKPPAIVEKMVDGGISKFLGEISLMGQAFVKDDKQTIQKMLAQHKSTVRKFAYLVVGEGIERKATDFAAEVRAQAGLAQ